MKLTLLSKGFHAEKILIDGKELNRVSKIQVNMSGREVPTATIELIPDEIEIDGEFEVITRADRINNKIKGGTLLWKIIRMIKNKK